MHLDYEKLEEQLRQAITRTKEQPRGPGPLTYGVRTFAGVYVREDDSRMCLLGAVVLGARRLSDITSDAARLLGVHAIKVVALRHGWDHQPKVAFAPVIGTKEITQEEYERLYDMGLRMRAEAEEAYRARATP
jgi:hypothetical protein